MDLEPVKPLNSKINAGTSMLAQYLREDMTAKMRNVEKYKNVAHKKIENHKMLSIEYQMMQCDLNLS